MNIVKLLSILFLSINIIGCEKHDPEEIINPEVEKYIELLRSNSYDSPNLPAFTDKDIPALLKYRNDTHMISNFPQNPISSFWSAECKLGVYVLWTIESIRAVAINSEYLIMRFPSQNPILALRDAKELTWVFDEKSHEIAAQAYYGWWYKHMQMDFNVLMHIDPLKNTDYKWQ